MMIIISACQLCVKVTFLQGWPSSNSRFDRRPANILGLNLYKKLLKLEISNNINFHKEYNLEERKKYFENVNVVALFLFLRILTHCGPLSWSQWPPVIEVNHYYDVLVGRGIPKPSFLAKGDDAMMIRVGNFNARKATYWRQFIGTFWFEILIQSY